MWINLQPDQLELIKKALDQASLSTTFNWTACRDLKVKIEKWTVDQEQPLEKHYRQVAFERHHSDGNLEVDFLEDTVPATVNVSEDGAYVMAWLRIDADDADVCRKCGDFPGSPTHDTVGDGYDGLCPSCADKVVPDEEVEV